MCALLLCVVALLLGAGNARAVPTFSVAAGECDNGVPQAKCSAGVDFVDLQGPQLILRPDPAWADFGVAFDAWNSTLPATQQWSLRLGELGEYSTITVTLYEAYIDGAKGGGTIVIAYTPGGGDPPRIDGNGNDTIDNGEAVWAQSIWTNQKRVPSLPGNPYLDNAPGTMNAVIGPPFYPYQFVDSHFEDMPSRPADAVWRAEAWLSTADFTDRILTIYAGVEWGFTVPEPATLAILCFGLAGFGFVRRQRCA